jgi:hypothetical protein
MDAEQYIKILEENLLTIEEVGEKVFMQDGAPCHRSKKTR